MSFLSDVRAKRQKLADVLADEEYCGIREIVEELYPDKAHFIYELLQNAEDAHATAVTFTLENNRLLFEHDGRPFSEADVWGITNIGKGTKKDDEEAIGKFGVGFKAVFAYTETPQIYSPTIAFEISDLVLPKELTQVSDLGNITRFAFPLNGRKKTRAAAHSETLGGLQELSEATLLFLTHIQSIRWRVVGGVSGEVLRISHSANHIEAVKQIDGRTTVTAHFLRFTQPVEGLEKQQVAVAFSLDSLPTAKTFDAKKPLAKQFRIVPAVPGRVAVFFTADKETSGLRFHLHAPFVPELSRASIKDTEHNRPLFQQLAALTVQALFAIRNLGLLSGDFLAVLPNPHDEIPHRYECIRSDVITAMNQQPLTPTHARSHAPAENLLQAKASLKALLSDDDIAFLVDEDGPPRTWAIAATQKNSDADRFLSGLAIAEWDVEQFVRELEEHLSSKVRMHTGSSTWTKGPDETFTAWLSAKTDEWHQRMYALLYRELETQYGLSRLNRLCLVRLKSGEYRAGDECYFATDGTKDDLLLPRVSEATYTYGKNKAEQDSAQKLLKAIGVRNVGDFEQVEAILKQRYSEEVDIPTKSTYKKDLTRFFSLVEANPKHATLFADYWIFERADEKWGQPSQVYLDAPYLETGLSVYYGALKEEPDRVALASSYQELGVSVKKLVAFATLVGVSTRLEVEQARCQKNPDWPVLRDVPGERYTSPVNEDYAIPGLDIPLQKPTVELSRLIWKTLSTLPKNTNCLSARYQKSHAHGSRRADSQLVHQLRSARWVPQGQNGFVKPAEASRDLLPEGFPFDPGWPWIKALRFGEESARKIEENRKKREIARDLGFDDDDALNDGKWFARLDPAERQRFRDERNRRSIELPDHEPGNPERRTTRVSEQASEAPERVTDRRPRSVSIGREAVKKDTDPYLRQQYSNSDGIMICQACKDALPFKLDDGSYYYEAVEFLPELKKRHYQNYLSLCPNHAAMFQHALGSQERMRDLLLELVGNELPVLLAGQETTLYFTKTHITDLKAIIATEGCAATDVTQSSSLSVDDSDVPIRPPSPIQ